MKNGLYMAILNAKNRGWILVNRWHQHHNLNTSARKFFFYELLEPSQIIKTELYQQQLIRLSDAIEEKRLFAGQGSRKIILIYDNAKPHTAETMKEIILSLGWEILPHATYSPDITPSSYYLSIDATLSNTHFDSIEDVQNFIDDFIASKPSSFYAVESDNCPIDGVIDVKGEYFYD